MAKERFVETYVPMAKEGKTALEIADALKIDGSAEKRAKYVSIRASQIRQELKNEGKKKAEEDGLSAEEKEKYISQLVDMIPKLKTRKRKSTFNSFVSHLENVLTQCDETEETKETIA